MPPADNRKPVVGETARTGPGEGQKRDREGSNRDTRDRDREDDSDRGSRSETGPGDDREEQEERTFAEEGMSQRELAARIRDLENTLAATRAGLPLTLLPEHGAGPGGEVWESWSQYHQELAINGEDLP
jgi:hypothetical protein